MADARQPDLPAGTPPVTAPAADPAPPMLSAMTGGNTVGADVRENTPRSDGFRHIDTPTLVSRVKAMHATTFRLIDKMGVGWWPMDVGIDDLTAGGITVRNPGIEDTSGWTLTRSDPSMQPYIDLYHADDPVRVINAIGAGYADILGQGFTPLDRRPGRSLQPTLRARLPRMGAGRSAIGGGRDI